MNIVKNPKGRVILTHGRSLHALVAAQSLGKQGIEVIACDSTPLMSLSFSKYVTHSFLYTDPDENPQAFLQTLQDQVIKNKPESDIPYVLMPIHKNTRFIAEHKDRFKEHIQLTAPDIASISQIFPKHHLVKTAKKFTIPIPETHLIQCDDDISKYAKQMNYPVFLKVPDGSGGKGLIKADNHSELVKGYAKIKENFAAPSDESPLLLQEGVEGDDYCCSGLFQNGELLTGMVHYNIQRFPYEGGFGVVRETVSADKLLTISSELMKKLQWNGVAQLDFRWDGKEESEAHLIEVNPRFWASLFHCVESGIDYPWLLYQMTVGADIGTLPKAEIGVRTKIPVLSILSAIEDSLQDQSIFDRIQLSWNTSWEQIKSGKMFQGWDTFTLLLQELSGNDNPYQKFCELMQDSKTAKQEFLSSDDPLVSLGVLYIAGSLLRYGKLPDEFNR